MRPGVTWSPGETPRTARSCPEPQRATQSRHELSGPTSSCQEMLSGASRGWLEAARSDPKQSGAAGRREET